MKKKLTIIDKVINILGQGKELSLSEIYPKLSNHSHASIRGNINRYISKNKNPKIRRVGKGVYSIVEVLKVQHLDENTSKIDYVNTCTYNDKKIAFFHKDYVLNNTSIKEGKFEQITNFSNYSNMINNFKSIQSVIAEGDTKEVLKRFKDESFDCLLTDPAYSCISGGTSNKKGTPSGILSKNDGKIFEDNDIKFEDWLGEAYRVLKKGAQAYIFTNFKNLYELMTVAQKVGFKFHNLLVWEKNNAVCNRWYMKNAEYILFCRKGKAKPINNSGCKTVMQFDNIIGKKIHETEKPLNLIETLLLNSTKIGDWILEPFGGSFVTNIAGLIHGRKVFSIDSDKKYINQGINRLCNFIRLGKDRIISPCL